MFEALGIQHVMRMCHIVCKIFPHYLTKRTIFGGGIVAVEKQ